MSEVKKRLRIFAGPNGSGKSTLFNQFSKNYKTGYFINADLIEEHLKQKGFIDLEEYGISASQVNFDSFMMQKNAKSLLQKAKQSRHEISLFLKDNFIVSSSTDKFGYEGALIASFLRERIMDTGKSFSFETVMSHSSKLEEIKQAKEKGYLIYLYFICIDDADINISRVENRKQKGGHNVETPKIIDRYTKTLKNLFPAIELCDKGYLFDNSGKSLILIADVIEQCLTLNMNEEKLPLWFKKYVLNHFTNILD